MAKAAAGQMASSAMVVLLIYHIALGLFAVYILLAIWPASLPITATRTVQLLFGRLSFTLTVELTLLVTVVFAALLGAFVHSVGSIAYHRADQDLEEPWTAWYVVRPFLGVGLALILYFALRAGFLSLGTEAATINLYGVAALSGIVGLFTARATEKLKDVAEALLKPVTEPPEDEEEEKTADTETGASAAKGGKPSPAAGTPAAVGKRTPGEGPVRPATAEEGTPPVEKEEIVAPTGEQPPAPAEVLGEISKLRERIRRLEGILGEN